MVLVKISKTMGSRSQCVIIPWPWTNSALFPCVSINTKYSQTTVGILLRRTTCLPWKAIIVVFSAASCASCSQTESTISFSLVRTQVKTQVPLDCDSPRCWAPIKINAGLPLKKGTTRDMWPPSPSLSLQVPARERTKEWQEQMVMKR